MTAHDTTYNPNLKKNGSLMWYVVLVSIIFLILFVLNVVDVMDAGQLFET